MRTRYRLLTMLLAFWLVSFPGAQPARASAPHVVQWKKTVVGQWPPAVIGSTLVLKNGDQLSAYHLSDSRELWRRKLKGLLRGPGTMAASERYLYVLGSDLLYLLDPKDGKVIRKRSIDGARSVLYRSGKVVISAAGGIFRLNEAGDRQISVAKGFVGELKGGTAEHAVIYTVKTKVDPKLSPKRLLVVDLKRGRLAYEFKLLPVGDHRVVRVSESRVVFIDFSQRNKNRRNARKLYYTEADYLRSKKIKDVSLSKKFPAAYAADESDTFWVAGDASGVVFLGNHGSVGAHSTLMAYAPGKDKMLWSRSNNVLSSGLLLQGGKLWTSVSERRGKSQAVAYNAEDGNLMQRIELDGPAIGAPFAAGGERVLLRTQRSIVCLAAGKEQATSEAASATRPSTRPGWRLYQDKVAGYMLQAPKTWRLDRNRIVKMGGLRMSIPFVRQSKAGGKSGGKSVYMGSVNVLTWEAADRDVNGLWQSVYTQQRRLHPNLRVKRVVRVANVGGTGIEGIEAVYVYRHRAGYPVQLKSLCVVSHGVAFELRGWAGPMEPKTIWKEISGIFRSFKPHAF